jgi:hypothetical protein
VPLREVRAGAQPEERSTAPGMINGASQVTLGVVVAVLFIAATGTSVFAPLSFMRKALLSLDSLRFGQHAVVKPAGRSSLVAHHARGEVRGETMERGEQSGLADPHFGRVGFEAGDQGVCHRRRRHRTRVAPGGHGGGSR